MCLAIPARVVELTGEDTARIDLGGVRKEISLALVDDVAVGGVVVSKPMANITTSRPGCCSASRTASAVE